MKNQFKTGLMVACSALALAVTGGMVGCAGDRYQQSAGKVMDDAAITQEIKADLNVDPQVRGHEIDVTTQQGVVRLDGFVDTDEQRQKAGQIARSLPQVITVQNNLAVKLEPAGAEAPSVSTPKLAPREHDP